MNPIKVRRKRLGLTQRELATISKVSRTTISMLENADSFSEINTNVKSILSIAKALDCSVDKFFLPLSSNKFNKKKEVKP